MTFMKLTQQLFKVESDLRGDDGGDAEKQGRNEWWTGTEERGREREKTE